MTTLALPRVKVKFVKPKFPSKLEVIDYFQAVGHIAAVLDYGEIVISRSAYIPVLSELVFLFLVLGTWLRWRGHYGMWERGRLPPLEGRKDRFVTGAIAGIAVWIGLTYIGINRFIPWIWLVILLSIIEKKNHPTDTA